MAVHEVAVARDGADGRMNSFDEIYERIKFATNARTQVELANLLEIRQSSISDAKRRRSVPADWFIKLHDKFGLSIDWLRWKAGPMYSPGRELLLSDAAEAGSGRQEGEKADCGPDFCPPPGENPAPAVLLREGETAAGGPDLLREIPAEMPMPRGVVTRVLDTACEYAEEGGAPDFSVREFMVLPRSLLGEGRLVFYVDSGGMEPTLRKGARVGVDTGDRRLISGEVYGLLMPHEGVAFRRIVQDSESGLFMLCFEQSGLPSTRAPLSSLESRILGRVLWTIQPV